MEERPYQTNAINAVRGLMHEHHDRIVASHGRKPRVVLNMATGSGKTNVACQIMRQTVDAGNRCIFMVPGRELIKQGSEHLEMYGLPYGTEHAILMAGIEEFPECPIQIVSPDTLWSRRARIEWPKADLVVWDECHGVAVEAKTMRTMIDAYPDSLHLGLTATPGRSSDKPISCTWDILYSATTYESLISQGYLLPTVVYAPSIPDLTGVKMNEFGEFVVNDTLLSAMTEKKIVGNVINTWMKLASDRQTVVFGINLKHSVFLRDLFRANGVKAEHVDANTPSDERDEIISGFKHMKFQVLCNYNIVGTGVNIPTATCICNCRMTGSLVWWRQSMNRIQRPSDQVPFQNALIIDHTGSVWRHLYPDEDILWPWDENASIKQALIEKYLSKPPGQREPVECPNCHAIWRGEKVCPGCGMQIKFATRSKQLKEVPGSLREVSRAKAKKASLAKVTDKQKYWKSCLGVAATKGRTFRAAYAMYYKKFHEFPAAEQVSPIPPKADLDSKVRVVYPGFYRKKEVELVDPEPQVEESSDEGEAYDQEGAATPSGESEPQGGDHLPEA